MESIYPALPPRALPTFTADAPSSPHSRPSVILAARTAQLGCRIFSEKFFWWGDEGVRLSEAKEEPSWASTRRRGVADLPRILGGRAPGRTEDQHLPVCGFSKLSLSLFPENLRILSSS